MISQHFKLSQSQLDALLVSYPKLGKSSHVGNLAVKIVEMYFLSKYPDATFGIGHGGADIEVTSNGKTERYEIKGTEDKGLAWGKLKVSSQDCHDSLINGMILIRVTGIGARDVTLHFMKFEEDFTIVPEIRFALKPLKK